MSAVEIFFGSLSPSDFWGTSSGKNNSFANIGNNALRMQFGSWIPVSKAGNECVFDYHCNKLNLLAFQMHMATRLMSVSSVPWATHVFPPSTTASSPALLSLSLSPSLIVMTTRKTWVQPVTIRRPTFVQMEPRPWRALELRSPPTDSFLKMRWRRAAFL